MTAELDLVDPLDFTGPQGRLLIDTSVFMDPTPARRGGLKALLVKCGPEILNHPDRRIVVPADVVEELRRQSRKTDADRSNDPERRAEQVRRAGVALEFIEDTAKRNLVRTDIGHATSKTYADSVFAEIFRRYSDRYDLCLFINDITPLLQVRLLAQSSARRLVAGALTSDGMVEVESNQRLYERGQRKLSRKQAEGDTREVAALTSLLADFRGQFAITEPAPKQPTPKRVPPRPASQPAVVPFDAQARLQSTDAVLEVGEIPGVGDKVHFESPSGSGTVVLDTLLGEGGEGAAFAVDGNRVVKIFARDQITWHRRDKVMLLVARGIRQSGICVPEALVTNAAGEFVGYMMPRAQGNEFRVIMNPRRFLKTFPGWTKADLVDVCISFLQKVSYLHSLNIVVGDINPKNVIVGPRKHVWIIDADSWQLEGYPCPVGTPMFTAASAQGRPYAESLRTIEEERFAVATMLFMVLITGQYPYARAGSDGDIPRLVREGIFAFQFGERSNRDQPEGNWKYMWSHLPRQLKELFWNTFHREGSRYATPPSADEWLRAFRQYRTWLGSPKNFDPMSNDVYPVRFKARRSDTPIMDCPQCRRPNALVGEWDEAAQSHSTAPVCFDCRQQNRPRCTDCGAPKPAGALRDGRCMDCNRKREFGKCERCGKETPTRFLVSGRCSSCQLAPCKSCHQQVVRSDLTYGRCSTCEKKAKTLDPSRLCVDCKQPYITFDHVQWFLGKGLDVAKSHVAVKKSCPPTGSRTPRPAGTNTVASAVKTSRPVAPPAPPSLWARIAAWWNNL